MGTGSGAIVIALSHEQPSHRYLAMDRSMDALCLARQNARKHGVDDRIDWYCGDWDAPLKKDRAVFDLIVSNPPYIPGGDIQGLQKDVRDYEPRLALDGAEDGLACLETIIFSAHHHLRKGGLLALEMGYDQADAVIDLADRCGGYHPPRIIKDYAGLDRVAIMAKKI